jgi:hypothetical protein
LQGYRIIKTQNSRYESVLDQYVKEFEVNNVKSGAPIGTKVYGYTKTEYITPTLLKNFLTNSSNFTATTAWSGDEVATRLFLFLQVVHQKIGLILVSSVILH